LEVELRRGAAGQFEVLADGTTVAKKGGGWMAKLVGGGFPDPADVLARLRLYGVRQVRPGSP